MGASRYQQHFQRHRGGHRPLTVRAALGALIIKERLGLTDRETVEQIRENPYLQYFLGFASYASTAPFDASLMVHFRKRLGFEVIQTMNALLIERMVRKDNAAPDQSDSGAGAGDDDDVPPTSRSGSDDADVSAPRSDDADPSPRGQLIMDATCAPADITYPTDLKLVHHAREVCEHIIDVLHAPHVGTERRPRTHRKRARKLFVNAAKSKKVVAPAPTCGGRKATAFSPAKSAYDHHPGEPWALESAPPESWVVSQTAGLF